jgi:adenylate cyclase
MPSLVVITTDGQRSDFQIGKQKITIGRNKDNDLILSDKTVSRHHARITLTKLGCLLTDLGSSNGTRVNEKPIQRTLLRHDDKIRMGRSRLIFVTEKEKEPPPEEHSLLLTTDDEYDNENKHIVKSPSAGGAVDSQELLISAEDIKVKAAAPAASPEETQAQLQRRNKVLWLLFEISRQLNSIHDFRELLKKIMDLIFRVIDADYGFLILTGEENDGQLTPIVVKYKGNQEWDKGKLKASRTIIDKVIHDKEAILTSNAMADSRFGSAKSIFFQKLRSVICAPLWRKDRIIGVIQLHSVRFDNQFTRDDLELLKAIGSQMAMILEQDSLNEKIREEETLRGRLERYLPPQLVEMLVNESQQTKDYVMEPKEVTATIVFTDIIGFTRLAEGIPPQETNRILNRYFSAMTEIIFSYDGTLDKYLGDGLMAFFGAPMEREDDAERAILAARDMREKLAAMRAEKAAHGSSFEIRIGINTGRVVAGNIGSLNRMDYTVIGDPVNVASALESIAQPNQILIGEETYRAVKDKFKIREIGPRRVKGKTAEIMVYEVI